MDQNPGYIHFKNARELVAAIIEQGVEDVLKGDPGALAWLDGRDFDHWCAFVDIDPGRARRAIHAQRANVRPKYSAEKLRRTHELHDRGRTWKDAITEVFGYYSETMRNTVIRYYNAQGAD